MQIINVSLEAITRDITGNYNGLQGEAEVKEEAIVLTFPLSRATLQTIQDCIQRDFKLALELLLLGEGK